MARSEAIIYLETCRYTKCMYSGIYGNPHVRTVETKNVTCVNKPPVRYASHISAVVVHSEDGRTFRAAYASEAGAVPLQPPPAPPPGAGPDI